jgi:hypothetical protein
MAGFLDMKLTQAAPDGVPDPGNAWARRVSGAFRWLDARNYMDVNRQRGAERTRGTKTCAPRSGGVPPSFGSRCHAVYICQTPV